MIGRLELIANSTAKQEPEGGTLLYSLLEQQPQGHGLLIILEIALKAV